MKYAEFALQFDIVTSLSYAKVLGVQQLQKFTIAFYTKENVLMFLEMRSEDLDLLPLWELEFSIDPACAGRLLLVIAVYSVV